MVTVTAKATTLPPAPLVAQPKPKAEPASDAYHKNCAAARAAGAAPLRRGEAGYRAGLDRDNDGVACES
ncbi:MAG: excalibur calcium-binding domain-containing protein [Arachnia sp.]